MPTTFSRRHALKTAGGAAVLGLGAGSRGRQAAATAARARQDAHEIVHWSWLTASDGEVWRRMIDAFNEAHQDQGVRIRLEVVPADQYGTKVLAAAAVGRAPDFGWGTAGLRADWIAKGVVRPLDELFVEIGFDLGDVTDQALAVCRYAAFDGKLYAMPIDAMSLELLVNTEHAAAAGLDPAAPPATGEELLTWADRLTVRDGERVTRSGFLLTGAGAQPAVVWGIVAHQFGFRRASDDLTQAAVDPDAGARAAQWVLDLFDTHKVASRDVTDRYRAFGTGQASMFLTGPWTLNGYANQQPPLPFVAVPMPKVGADAATYFELGGLELYVQADDARYATTARALKWLSDNSFLWTTEGRGAAVRRSILNRPDYRTAGLPWSVRGAFVDNLPNAVIGEVPVIAAPAFTIYTDSGFVAQTMDPVWANDRSADEAIALLRAQWQADLDAG